MRTDKQRTNKYTKKVRGLVLPTQKSNFNAVMGKQVELEQMVKSMDVGIIKLPYYIIFAKELYKAQGKHSQDVLGEEAYILEEKWKARGLDETTLEDIKDAMGITAIAPPVPPSICQPYELDANTRALYHCDDGAGVVVTDDTGNYNMTASNALIWAGTGRFNGDALYLNNLYNATQTAIFETPPADGSIEFWFKPDVTLNPAYPLTRFFFDFSGALASMGCVYDRGADVIRWRIKTTAGVRNLYGTTTVFTAGTWHHICVTWGSNGLKLYVDNIEEANNPDTNPLFGAVGSTFYLGTLNAVASAFDGTIDEVRISNVQRTPDFCNPEFSWPW